MTKYLLTICLSCLTLTASLHSQPAHLFNRWYAIFQWEPVKEFNRGSNVLIIFRDSTARFEADSLHHHDAVWSYDSVQHRLVIATGPTRYFLTVMDSTLVGTMSSDKEKGYVEAYRNPTAEWDSLTSKHYRGLGRKDKRLGLDFATAPKQNLRLHFGMITNPKRTSFNMELATLSVLKKDDRTYVSSNLIFLGVFGGLYALFQNDKEKIPFFVGIPLLFESLTNFDVSIPLGTPLACADIGQATDYYFFYSDSRIVTETRVGLMLDFQTLHIPLQFNALYSVPWSHGYQELRENYVTGRVSWVF